ncbi:hypothetical protein DPMN_193120 [Dreissena polymorpha]|uniref:Uncharacterized protein n=1 Tax=Dreissena polymorpha TaxID=45954 RepID=A0A9D4BF95_DREPO|nr:hypothetical protein DPMN_193120 [Dreissena polymorpha]
MIFKWLGGLFYHFEPTTAKDLSAILHYAKRGSSGLMVGRWRRDREVPGSNPAPTTGISLSKKFIPHLLLSTKEISQCAVAAYCAKMLTDPMIRKKTVTPLERTSPIKPPPQSKYGSVRWPSS